MQKPFVYTLLSTCFITVFLSVGFLLRCWPVAYPNSIVADISFPFLLILSVCMATLVVFIVHRLVLPHLPHHPFRRWGGLAVFGLLFLGLFFALPKPQEREYRSFFQATMDGRDQDGDPMLNTPAVPKKPGVFLLHPVFKGKAQYDILHLKDTSAEKPRWKIGLESAETAEKRKLSDGVIYEFIFSGNGLPTKKISIDCKATDRRRYVENATGYSNVDIHVLPGAAGNHRFDMVQILPESYAQFSGLPLLLFHLGNFLCIAALPFVPFLLFCGYKTCRSNPEIPRRWGTILVWPFYRNGICTYLLFSLPIIGFALFGAYMIMRAETGYYRFHDTLDGCVSLILSQVNQSENVFMLFARRPLDSIMCGSTYCTLPNFVILLFYIFSLIPALAVNFSVVHIIAYVGMYLLLTRHVVKDDRSCMTGIMVAFLFSCFGFYEVMGITIAGIPLLTYSLLNLFTRCYRWWDWVILLVVPSYMFAACSLIFLIAIACQCWILACIWNRKPNWIVLLGIAVVTLSWVVNERDMISRSLKNNSTGYVSFRTQFEKNNIDQVKSKPLINLAGFNYDTYIKRYEKDYVMHHFMPSLIPVFCAILMTLFIFLKNAKIGTTFWVTASLVFWLYLMQSIQWNPLFFYVTGHQLPPINIRFFWLYSTAWMCLFASCLNEVRKFFPLFSRILLISTLFVWFFAATLAVYGKTNWFGDYYKEYRATFVVRQQIAPPKNRLNRVLMSKLFGQAKAYIGKSVEDYRVGSIGIAPALAQLHEFHTIDGYSSEYHLNHKIAMRKIIANELEKSTKLPRHAPDGSWKKYFDNWGARCYLATPGNPTKGRFVDLSFDKEALLDLNCQYIFASCPVDNPENLGWRFEKKFTQPDPYLSLYLYKVLPGPAPVQIEENATGNSDPSKSTFAM